MTEFIAEICSNHNGDLNRALALIDKAAEIGCAGVKFQLFRIDSLFAPEALRHPDYQFIHARRQWELPLDWLPVLKARCIERGIKFGCTPFYVNAVEELLPFVDFYKVASYSLLHRDLLRAIAKTGKPVVLSTGMATVREIRQAMDLFGYADCKKVTILNCVSAYPTPISQVNPGKLSNVVGFSALPFGWSFGWSDHTVSPEVIYCFTLSGFNRSSMVEFHFDLDGQGWEYDIGHCWLPGEMEPVIKTVKVVQKMQASLFGYVSIEEFSVVENNERLWRADPSDGLRPVMEERKRLR